MRYILAAVLALSANVAMAQQQNFQNQPVGQTAGGAINQTTFNNNTDPTGFNERAMSPAVVGAGTTQATATVIPARTNVITSCPAGAGVRLPAVQGYVGIVVLNRSGGACNVYPSNNAAVETAPGVAGAVGAAFAMPSNTNTIFRPLSATAWAQ